MMYAVIDMPLNPSRCHPTHGCYESPCGAEGNGQYGVGGTAMGWVVAGSTRPQDWMRSRWLRLESCAGDDSPTELDNSTEACLSAAIRYAGTAEGRAKFLESDTRLWYMADPSNPDVRDVYVDKSEERVRRVRRDQHDGRRHRRRSQRQLLAAGPPSRAHRV